MTSPANAPEEAEAGPGASAASGLRPPTVFEAIARRLGVPHVVAVIGVAIILGAPLLPYAVPGREDRLFTSVFNPHMGQIHGLPDLLYQGLLFGLLVFSPLATRFMLQRIWQTPASAPALAHAIANEIAATAKDGTRLAPPFAMAGVLLLVFLVPYVADGYVTSVSDAAILAIEALLVLGRFATLFFFVWVYVRGIRGIRRISSASLSLAPSYEDPWLGTRPIGSLALALAATYFLGLALALLWVLFGYADPFLLGMTVALFVMGLALFFLPLHALHAQMAAEKGREQAWLRERLAAFVPVSRLQPPIPGSSSLDDLRSTFALGIAERHINAIRTWPFDTSILVRLTSSVCLPLALTLIGRQLVLAVLGL